MFPRVFRASLELSAGGAGVGAPAATDRRGQMLPNQALHESVDRGFVRTLPAGQVDRVLVQRNDVDLDGDSAQQARQPRRVLRRVVDAGNQNVLHGDAPARFERPAAHGCQEPRERIRAGDRHDLRARLFVRGVQRDREVRPPGQRGESLEGRRDAGGRDGHAPRRDLFEEHLERAEDPVRVQERLAHSHEDHPQPFGVAPDVVQHRVELPHDLGRREIPSRAQPSRHAERAVHRASRLRRQDTP